MIGSDPGSTVNKLSATLEGIINDTDDLFVEYTISDRKVMVVDRAAELYNRSYIWSQDFLAVKNDLTAYSRNRLMQTFANVVASQLEMLGIDAESLDDALDQAINNNRRTP